MNLDSASHLDAAKSCFLGLDAGGTQTRWALATSTGELICEGATDGFSAARMMAEDGNGVVHARLKSVAEMVLRSLHHHRLSGVHAGVTGIGADAPRLVAMMSRLFDLAPHRVSVTSDAELAYRTVLAPGEGYLVYAGTGSIAAFIDAAGALHRAGGRGVMLDDAGGGYWIAREALRRVWRREDEQPGVWRDSPMARALFVAVGGDSSIFSARFLMDKERGEIGMLARVVAEHADDDALALEILRDAGVELARLANAMLQRYGERRVVVAGRASQLHSLIESSMRQAMAVDATVAFRQVQAHIAAARLAAEK